MSIELSTNLVKTLKGAPLSCLLILMFEGQPVSAQYLERHSGYSDKSVNSALLLLEEMGAVTRNGRYTWQIANNVIQLPLMEDLIESPLDPPLSKGGKPGVGEIPSRRISESENFRVPDEENAENIENIPRESENFRLDCPSSSTSRSINLESREELLDSRVESENFRVDVLGVLDEFGVGEPKRSQLARMKWITPRVARYHLETCEDVALAIWRMEKGWRVPKEWKPKPAFDVRQESPFVPLQEGGQIPTDQVEAFNRAMECLRANIPPGIYATWATGLQLAAPLSHGSAVIRAANRQVIREMEPYTEIFGRLLSSEFGTAVKINYIVR